MRDSDRAGMTSRPTWLPSFFLPSLPQPGGAEALFDPGGRLSWYRMLGRTRVIDHNIIRTQVIYARKRELEIELGVWIAGQQWHGTRLAVAEQTRLARHR